MNRVWIVVVIGALCGAIAHTAWFTWRRPASAGTGDDVLAWLQTDLKLTPQQFARVKAIHEQSRPRLQQLATQAERMSAELARFENARVTSGQIDFLQFARFVQERREFDRACMDSTQVMVAAISQEMNADQRERYLHHLIPALSSQRQFKVN